MEAIERLARILPDDHRVVTNGVDNRCTFVNTNLDPILEGLIFRVGTYVELDEKNAGWTWEMKYREPFALSCGTADFTEFCERDTTRVDCAKLLDWLRICALIIDCNYVDLRGGVGYFIRGLKLCDGVCVCGKRGNAKCSRCKKNYCSRACQVGDWKYHKADCSQA
jgi:hypothetical protein